MRIFLIAAFILALSIAASAQNVVKVYADPTPPDTLKLSVSFANTDFSLDNVQGIQAELDAKVLKYEKFRIGGVFHYVRPNFGAVTEFDTYSFGPSVSYDLFHGSVTPFGRALFGLTTDYNGSKAFTRTYGFGLDVNLGHVFVRPFNLDYQRFEGLPVTVERYGAGVGIRF